MSKIVHLKNNLYRQKAYKKQHKRHHYGYIGFQAVSELLPFRNVKMFKMAQIPGH